MVKQVRTFADERLRSFCVYCHGPPSTRDHVPPRVFLDTPYPDNLPVVGSCKKCNEGASLDEEYVACLLEVAACGSANPGDLARPPIARKLAENPGLAARLQRGIVTEGDTCSVQAEVDRVQRVVEKIGRALWNFEGAETTGLMVATTEFAPIHTLAADDRERFLAVAVPEIWPEVGSRMMTRMAVDGGLSSSTWEHVQAERFSYAIEIALSGVRVKMLVRGYLAAVVTLATETGPV
jgi:hypothetical protein